MSTLHVRNVPDDLYEALRDVAQQRKTSISDETIRLLGRAIRLERRQVGALLDELEATRPTAKTTLQSGAALIRSDRESR